MVLQNIRIAGLVTNTNEVGHDLVYTDMSASQDHETLEKPNKSLSTKTVVTKIGQKEDSETPVQSK